MKDLKAQLENLHQRTQMSTECLDLPDKQKQIEELTTVSNLSDLWSNPNRALEVTSRLQQISQLVDA